MTTINQEAPTFAGAPSISSLNDGIDSTARIVKMGWSRELVDLSPNECDQLASILHDRADTRRVQLTYESALDAFNAAPVSAWHPSAPSPNFNKIRITTKLLVSEHGYHPEQVKHPMSLIAFAVCEDCTTALLAVETGISDALEVLRERARQ